MTEAGERLLARLRPLLADFDAAIDSLNDFRDTPSGTLRLTMPSVVATWVVAPMLPQFLAQYPEIKMEIVITNRMIDIVAERFDAARPDHAYLHFGLGHHECLGRYVAGAMIPEIVRRILLRDGLRALGPVEDGGTPFPTSFRIAYGAVASP